MAVMSITLRGIDVLSFDDHRLFTTIPAFLKYLGLRDLADLPRLPDLETQRLEECSHPQPTLYGRDASAVDYAFTESIAAAVVVARPPQVESGELVYERDLCGAAIRLVCGGGRHDKTS
jgi:hypothetical protein